MSALRKIRWRDESGANQPLHDEKVLSPQERQARLDANVFPSANKLLIEAESMARDLKRDFDSSAAHPIERHLTDAWDPTGTLGNATVARTEPRILEPSPHLGSSTAIPTAPRGGGGAAAAANKTVPSSTNGTPVGTVAASQYSDYRARIDSLRKSAEAVLNNSAANTERAANSAYEGSGGVGVGGGGGGSGGNGGYGGTSFRDPSPPPRSRLPGASLGPFIPQSALNNNTSNSSQLHQVNASHLTSIPPIAPNIASSPTSTIGFGLSAAMNSSNATNVSSNNSINAQAARKLGDIEADLIHSRLEKLNDYLAAGGPAASMAPFSGNPQGSLPPHQQHLLPQQQPQMQIHYPSNAVIDNGPGGHPGAAMMNATMGQYLQQQQQQQQQQQYGGNSFGNNSARLRTIPTRSEGTQTTTHAVAIAITQTTSEDGKLALPNVISERDVVPLVSAMQNMDIEIQSLRAQVKSRDREIKMQQENIHQKIRELDEMRMLKADADKTRIQLELNVSRLKDEIAAMLKEQNIVQQVQSNQKEKENSNIQSLKQHLSVMEGKLIQASDREYKLYGQLNDALQKVALLEKNIDVLQRDSEGEKRKWNANMELFSKSNIAISKIYNRLGVPHQTLIAKSGIAVPAPTHGSPSSLSRLGLSASTLSPTRLLQQQQLQQQQQQQQQTDLFSYYNSEVYLIEENLELLENAVITMLEGKKLVHDRNEELIKLHEEQLKSKDQHLQNLLAAHADELDTRMQQITQLESHNATLVREMERMKLVEDGLRSEMERLREFRTALWGMNNEGHDVDPNSAANKSLAGVGGGGGGGDGNLQQQLQQAKESEEQLKKQVGNLETEKGRLLQDLDDVRYRWNMLTVELDQTRSELRTYKEKYLTLTTNRVSKNLGQTSENSVTIDATEYSNMVEEMRYLEQDIITLTEETEDWERICGELRDKIRQYEGVLKVRSGLDSATHSPRVSPRKSNFARSQNSPPRYNARPGANPNSSYVAPVPVPPAQPSQYLAPPPPRSFGSQSNYAPSVSSANTTPSTSPQSQHSIPRGTSQSQLQQQQPQPQQQQQHNGYASSTGSISTPQPFAESSFHGGQQQLQRQQQQQQHPQSSSATSSQQSSPAPPRGAAATTQPLWMKALAQRNSKMKL